MQIIKWSLFFLLLVPGMTMAKVPHKIDLKVLYVGGTADIETFGTPAVPVEVLNASVAERMESFEEFLKEYFTTVTVIKGEDYVQSLSNNYDVTVMDGLPKPVLPASSDRSQGISYADGFLTEDFDRPMVTIGFISERIGRRIGSKNDWYCLCLLSDAHHWRAEHPIFHGPFDVRMTVVDKPTPEAAFEYPYHEGGPIPQQLPMWQVQTWDYMTDDNPRIGMVSRPGGYEDSPEAEYISSGVCAKSLDAVAIGRHGNFLHWGFAASPRYMTEEAKPVFANAIVYISKFAGQTPIARKYNDRAPTRSHADDLKHFLSFESYQRFAKANTERNEMMTALKVQAEQKQACGEKLDQKEQSALLFNPSPQQTYEQHLQSVGRQLYAMFRMDIEAYNKYFEDNYDYFYPGGGGLAVDEDAKGLGIPNNDKRILDAAIKMLESNMDADKGLRILKRYTLLDFQTPEQWRIWYDTHKDRLFFTESGGWVFLVNGRESGTNDYKAFEQRKMIERIKTEATSDDEPVAITAEIFMQRDGSRIVIIKANLHPGYHIYDNVAKGDVFLATVLDLSVPESYLKVGESKRPSGYFYNQNGTTVYRDSVVFSQELKGSGTGKIQCKVKYQCCDPNICFPPEEKIFTLDVK